MTQWPSDRTSTARAGRVRRSPSPRETLKMDWVTSLVLILVGAAAAAAIGWPAVSFMLDTFQQAADTVRTFRP